MKQTVKDVKANEQQCARLVERINAICMALKSVNDRDLQRLELRKSLTDIRCETGFERSDLNTIQSKLDEIATLMIQRQNEQFHYIERIEQNVNQRFNSFKHKLEQDILKTKDPLKAQKIIEVEQAFLHIPYYDLIQEKRIGQGGFADVYRGKWLSRSQEVAIKVIRFQPLDDKVKSEIVNEISTMYRIHYNHILNIFGACMETEKYALVVEYMSHGSLHDVLMEKTMQLTWPYRYSVAIQMTKGINYLHKLSKSIIHRNIKSLNILITKNEEHSLVKVADCGLAKIRYETSRQSSNCPSVGTIPWKAPELLKMGKHTEASDVYALGDRLDIPPDVPSSLAELISRAWAQESQKRPTCQQLLSWLEDISTEILVNEKLEAAATIATKKVEATSKETPSPQRPRKSASPIRLNEKEIATATASVAPNISANAKWAKKGVTIAEGHGEGSAMDQLNDLFGLFVDVDQTIIIANCGNARIIQWKNDDTTKG
ncbi:unnamed protein product [Rotaria magnacalcarata]|uniref:Protein kinase domain-containing protein n=4 Tax=Rotaria magnacalcarata TaxID=392030 RepID=A0A819PH76_9BILA|nr:unnamed protein product [Rotaria magnacalcarata]